MTAATTGETVKRRTTRSAATARGGSAQATFAAGREVHRAAAHDGPGAGHITDTATETTGTAGIVTTLATGAAVHDDLQGHQHIGWQGEGARTSPLAQNEWRVVC